MKLAYSPWGKVQTKEPIIPNKMFQVHTARHGGIKLDRELNKLVPACMRSKGGWYEEDCEWSIAFECVKHWITASDCDWAKQTIASGAHTETLKRWYPEHHALLY